MFGMLDLDRLQEILLQLIKVGKVSSIEGTSARVVFPDSDDVVSDLLPVLQHGARRIKGRWIPEVGEQVVCVFLPIGIETGFIIGSFYSSAQPAPDVDDGAVVLAGDSVHLGDPDADDPVVRKSDLQAAIDDLMGEIDKINNDLIGQIGAGGGPSGPPFEWTNTTSSPSAKASDKVYST